MRLLSKCLFLFIPFLFFCFSSYSQSKEDLQKERDAITKEIQLTNNLLEKTSNNRDKLQAQVSLINRKINLQEKLISSINSEINSTNKQIADNENEIKTLEEELNKLKKDYAVMIRYAYKNRNSYDRLMYIFASESFYQALKRMRYLRQYSDFRKHQAEEIQNKKVAVNQSIIDLEEKIKAKKALLSKEQYAQKQLSSDRATQSANVSQLQQEEKKLKKQLKKQEKEIAKLNKEIQRIIEAEIKASKKSNSGAFALTPEAAALSANFESNKGKLPWPVERGVITSKFGNNPHPVLAGIQVPNNGIDIATDENAIVRAIFKGTVSAVFSIPGAGENVIIDHGGYRTVYTHLSEVFVSKGQKIEMKQNIGKVLTDESNGKSEAHLEIWKVSSAGPQKQNPELWIFRQ